jgi:hypothetical protein
MDSNGNFVITWQSGGQDGDGDGIFAKRYDPNGIPQDAEFQVNINTTNNQWWPSTAMDSNGDFIIAWQSWEQDGDDWGIFARLYYNQTLPIISDVSAIPDPQEIYEAVNISANITDIGQIYGVSVEIYDPDFNFVGNFSMLYDPVNGRYYWDQSYDILGTYTFTIYANDTSDNWNSYSGSFIIQATMILKQGWNLISIPLIQEEQDLKKVLGSIDGLYDAVQWHDLTDKNDQWKHHKVGKPFGNDLTELNEKMGFWVHITQPGDTIFYINGTRIYQNQTITLHEGWNLVGYPSRTSYNRTEGLNNLTFGQEVDLIQWFDPSSQTWHDMGEDDYFMKGRGYWIHAKTECEWEVLI